MQRLQFSAEINWSTFKLTQRQNRSSKEAAFKNSQELRKLNRESFLQDRWPISAG